MNLHCFSLFTNQLPVIIKIYSSHGKKMNQFEVHTFNEWENLAKLLDTAYGSNVHISSVHVFDDSIIVGVCVLEVL